MRVFNGLRESGIMVQVNYLPAYRHPVFGNSDNIRSEFPNSEDFYNSEISLPMYSDLSSTDQDFVIEKVLNLVRT
jgi:perosamine synthetase